MRRLATFLAAIGLAVPARALVPEDAAAVARQGLAAVGFPVFQQGAAVAALPGRSALDLTKEFLDRQSRGDVDGELLTQLRGYKVLFVRGFLTDVYDRLGLGAFGDQLAWLKAAGVDCELVGFNTQAGLAPNAAAIAAAAESAAKPVLVISHSKGSLDVLEALLSHPERTKRIQGWISIQGPFQGSPIADWILSGPRLDPLAAWLLELLGGGREGLASLSVSERRAYMISRRQDVAAALRGRAVLCFGSWKDPDPGSRLDTLLKPSRDWMSGQGLKNDGLIPADSAFLDGAARVSIPGVDHAAPVMKTLLPLDRVLFTRTLLGLLLLRLPG
ncbi:MAG: hypothetical protein PHF00_00120 [Elusimicrobia bacterium]|nr:hypothetical protein [Elusimicrobiota bacterium]